MFRTTKTSLTALAVALATPVVLAVPAQAQDAAEQPAPLENLVEQVAIPYDQFQLDNGLTVIVHEDRKAPIVGVAVWYNVGSKDEPKGETGFAHLFEHLMFNGSENAPDDFFKYLQEMGATDYNGTTDFDRTNYFETVPTGALERALWLESDRMGYLLGAITQEKLDNQRGVVQNEKRQGDNQPGGLVFYEIIKTLYPEGHPYDHNVIGSMADLDAATMSTVQNWFRDNYGPNNATLVLAGDISAAEAKPLVEKYFGPIARGPVNDPAQADVPVLKEDVRTVMKDQVAATSIDKYYSVPGITDRDLTALNVGAQILGGLSSSRLDNALVRDEQIAISVNAGNYAFQRVGILDIGATAKPGVDPAVVEKRLNEIIADFIQNGPTEDEVRRAATSSLAGTIRGLEEVGGFGGKAVTLAEGEVLAGDPGFFERQMNILATLTPGEVKAAMQKWMTRPAMTLVLEPGEREGEYEEAASVASSDDASEDAAPAASEITVTKVRPAPEISQLTALDFPDVTETSLPNGIKVYYAQRDAVPATRVTISFDAGSAADPIDKRGLEGLTLGLMDEGTTTLNSRELAEAQERLGANISTGGGGDRSTFTLSSLSANLEPSLELLADVVRNPAFDPAEIERIRAQTVTSIQQSLKSPSGLAYYVASPLVYGADNPYGGSGTVESVGALTRDDLVNFKQTWLRPDNATVFVVSNLPLAEVMPDLEEAFGNWAAPATPKGQKDFSSLAAAPESARIVLVNRPNSPQSFIVGGEITPYSASDETIVDLTNANNALGGNFLARLNMNLRETKGWSYGVRGGPSINEGAVAYFVQAPVQADRTGDALAEIIKEVGEFVTTRGVTDEELTRNVNNEIRQLPGQFETSSAVLGAMQNNVKYGRPMDYYETLADKYRGQTVESLDAAARKAISPDRFVWVVVGDAEKVRPQLDKLGLPIETIEVE
ncbi:MAG: peptidase M16 [Citromicrobium sp.]|nr:peptidase M16 [Citromicrobium sp.]